ncbi:MAG: hypothetical protein FWJ74_07405 [Gemmatimonadota bacterium]|jgi:hypothetical protein
MLERKVYGERVRLFSERMNRVLYDAFQRIDADRERADLPRPLPEEVNLYSWPQTWPDNTFGFGGTGTPGQATTQTHVVKDERTGAVYVYHDGRFVRHIARPGQAFWNAVSAHNLPGAIETERWAELERG